MTDNEQSRAIDTDLLIGNMLHQTEAVVDIDEESLAQRKNQLLDWMAGSTPPVPQPGESQEREARRPQSEGVRERPLNDVVFLTVAEVASVMRVSKMTVYRLVHSGHLPAIRVGRSFRVPEQALHQYLYGSYTGSIESTDRP
jgi:excisionase family DNA binding protein